MRGKKMRFLRRIAKRLGSDGKIASKTVQKVGYKLVVDEQGRTLKVPFEWTATTNLYLSHHWKSIYRRLKKRHA